MRKKKKMRRERERDGDWIAAETTKKGNSALSRGAGDELRFRSRIKSQEMLPSGQVGCEADNGDKKATKWDDRLSGGTKDER